MSTYHSSYSSIAHALGPFPQLPLQNTWPKLIFQGDNVPMQEGAGANDYAIGTVNLSPHMTTASQFGYPVTTDPDVLDNLRIMSAPLICNEADSILTLSMSESSMGDQGNEIALGRRDAFEELSGRVDHYEAPEMTGNIEVPVFPGEISHNQPIGTINKARRQLPQAVPARLLDEKKRQKLEGYAHSKRASTDINLQPSREGNKKRDGFGTQVNTSSPSSDAAEHPWNAYMTCIARGPNESEGHTFSGPHLDKIVSPSVPFNEVHGSTLLGTSPEPPNTPPALFYKNRDESLVLGIFGPLSEAVLKDKREAELNRVIKAMIKRRGNGHKKDRTRLGAGR